MRRALVSVVFLAGFSSLNSSPAYELITHGLLTYGAYAQSKLQPGAPLRKDLGIDVYLADPTHPDKPFGGTYFDFTGIDARLRVANGPGTDGKPFDPSRMVTVRRTDGSLEFFPPDDNLRLPGWLMRGAIREDDDAKVTEPNPKDDPFDLLGLQHRVLGHFYDPISAKGLNGAGIAYGLPAPAWAIGVAP